MLVNGKKIDPSRRKALARAVQPIFQDPYSLLNPHRTVADIVGVPLRLHVGPVGGKAHTDNEYCCLETLVPRAQALLLTINALTEDRPRSV